MIPVEQFVYTTTSLGPLPGYQVVAKSPGIAGRTASDLEPYMLPAGMDPRNFERSKSMVTIREGTKVAYSHTRNIGRGPDGRPNAMSNHTLVIDTKSFEALSYDTHILDALFSDYIPTTPLLPTLEIPKDAGGPPDPNLAREATPLLARTLYTLVRGRGAAVRGDYGERFVQAALGLLPPSLRLVPFSTCAVDLRLQPAYRLVLLGDTPAGSLPKGFDLVDGRPRASPTGSTMERSVRYMIALASIRSPDLAALHAAFEKIPALPPGKRLAVLTAVMRMAQSANEMQDDRDAQMAIEHLAKLDPHILDDILSDLGARIGPHRRSDLVGLIASRRALDNISDYTASRPSVEMLLGQADGEGRLELLLALYKSKKSEVDDKITQLFEDFSYSYYNSDFFRFVASVPSLASRVKEFAGMLDKNQFKRQAVARLFVLAALKSGTAHLIEPGIFKPFDLNRGYDLDSFGSLFSEVLSSGLCTGDRNPCAAIATAGLTYMAGFGGGYHPVPTRLQRCNAEQFGALADRLGKAALEWGRASRSKSDNLKTCGQIAQLLRKCGIAAPAAGR